MSDKEIIKIIGTRGEDFQKFDNLCLTVNSINQTLNEIVIPLIKKHENALYSPDGTNGIVKSIYRHDDEITQLRETIEKNGIVKNIYKHDDEIKLIKETIESHCSSHWKVSSLIISAVGIIFTVINFILTRN